MAHKKGVAFTVEKSSLHGGKPELSFLHGVGVFKADVKNMSTLSNRTSMYNDNDIQSSRNGL